MSETGKPKGHDAPITLTTLARMKQAGERIACLTAYDAAFAGVLEAAGVEVLLVGDSLGMVVQGHDSTLPVGVDDMVYHAAAVARGSRRALRVVDLPFLSYATPERALTSAGRLMRAGGAHMVKLEGGREQAEVVHRLTECGVPVCGHLGLLPQSIHRLGGYRVQGREPEAARRLREDARLLEEAGAGLLVLECVPAALAREISRALTLPVIGIGAGPDCDGQVLVLYDLIGISPGRRPRFSKDFLSGESSVAAAVSAYVRAVKSGGFPGPEHTYT
ncbi:3-methyl-2-oxobutanoate hydroxymethyltransferase [bacterium BMS3Bbin12]|nr:3-methyl-2-oxobutanoate hydroxymethyltransferase [bacterium BMS3Abin12]GBE48562.1 3-methyl-2-oxobutanoate hydroxymethyltransferase [bacterium BMS3Bbin12]GBE51544.1 3-methyl-2-oxobutanoate hydroxymethyltransferase [bacterium BMS3Bbin13]HDK03345.1 3-methyl-2-oxobutanoate hydroxymethyltransferase [Gammaproteobacteria bacterium]